jgi:ribose-phosphate pyrophosphokinase
MIATGTSLVRASEVVRKHSPKSVHVVATHPVFCGKAFENMKEIKAEEIIVTDTIPQDEKSLDNLTILSVAELLGEAIRRIHNNESVSNLFI